MPGLHRRGLRRASAQLLARCLARPRAGIDIPHHAQPLLGFGLAREESHVKTETLASLLEPAADEEREALELGQIDLRERHRSRRGAQIEHERPCLSGRRCHLFRAHLGGRQICRWCHKFPGQSNSHGAIGYGSRCRGECYRSRVARPWQPRRHRNRPLDRWLCVPAFRRVCPCHRRQVSKPDGVESRPASVARLSKSARGAARDCRAPAYVERHA